jgi:hypothetical protein
MGAARWRERNGRTGKERWEETYEDTGCDLWHACLTCPLPACRYDMPPKQAAMYMRALKLLELLGRGRTMTMEQLAVDIGVSRRTVFRLMPYVRELERQRQAHVCAPNTA